MNGIVYAKTASGLDEIQSRAMKLHPRLRQLLVVVDGKKSVDQLLHTLEAAGVGQEHINQLESAGMIQPLQPGLLISEALQSEPENPANRQFMLNRLCAEAIDDTFGEAETEYHTKLAQAKELADYVAIANDIIVASNANSRVDYAIAFKERVRPYLR